MSAVVGKKDDLFRHCPECDSLRFALVDNAIYGICSVHRPAWAIPQKLFNCRLKDTPPAQPMSRQELNAFVFLGAVISDADIEKVIAVTSAR